MFKKDFVSNAIKALAKQIPFEDLSRFLPFQTGLVAGDNHVHIQYLGAYDVKTYGKADRFGVRPEYTVTEGDTLCRRQGVVALSGICLHPCPGCQAIAEGLIKRDIESA